MSDVTFNIYGGNNQILPNATKAEQNFYGDQFAEKMLAKDGEASQPLTDELIVKQSFISLLLPFVPKREKGQTIDNIRVAINTAWTTRKKTIRQAGR